MAVVQYTFTHEQYTEQQLWQSLVEYENWVGLGDNYFSLYGQFITALITWQHFLFSALYGQSAWHITPLFPNGYSLLCFETTFSLVWQFSVFLVALIISEFGGAVWALTSSVKLEDEMAKAMEVSFSSYTKEKAVAEKWKSLQQQVIYVQVTVRRNNLRINNKQDASSIQNFILSRNSTCFGHLPCPSAGVISCTRGNW